MGSSKVTNLLLAAVAALLVLNLAVPAMNTGPAPAAAPLPAPVKGLGELRTLIDELRVVIRMQADAPVVAARQEAPENALVVTIPMSVADEWGLSAEDVRTVIDALARAGKSMKRARPASNETAAIATLRNCCSAQAQFQACAKADADNDGTGEFGSFVEMSGARSVRGDERVGRLNPPVLSGAFRSPSKSGFVSRSGYYYVIYLPDSSGAGVIADAKGYSRVDSDRAETTWCMYAWPMTPEAGKRAFFMSQTGDVLATISDKYVGERAPQPGAAFKDGGRYSISGVPAVGIEAQDGNVWRQVN